MPGQNIFPKVDTEKKTGVSSFPVIPPPEQATEEQIRRIGQQDILPNALKTRLLGDIVQRTATAVSGEVSVATGSQSVLTITTSTDTGDLIIGLQDFALYIASDGNGADQFPGGTNVDETQWLMWWWNDWHAPNVAGNDSADLYTKIYMMNVSDANPTSYYLHAWCRLITNKPAS